MTDLDKKENEIENFDAVFRHGLELQRHLEKIEVAYIRTVERYGEYSDLKSFAEYLRTIEKMFTENSFRNKSFEQSKDELIKIRIKMLAKNSAMDEDVLNMIYGYFQKAGQSVDKIYEIANELLEKHKEDNDCIDFITYIRDIFVNFLNAEKEHISAEELKDRLVKARMEVLSTSGNPDLKTLENIYQEFKGLLNSK